MTENVLLHPSYKFHKQEGFHRLTWHCTNKSILIVHKLDDAKVLQGVKAASYYLLKYHNVCLMLEVDSLQKLLIDSDFSPIARAYFKDKEECKILDKNTFQTTSIFNTKQTSDFELPKILEDLWLNDDGWINPNSSLIVFNQNMANQPHLTDAIICLGGDGTLLHVGSLFQNTVPPVIAFYMGSLGFLTTFNFEKFPNILNRILTEGGDCILRSRLCCNVRRGGQSSSIPNSTLPSQSTKNSFYHVLNEASFVRGNCPYLSNLILKVDGKEVSSIQGDGLIISTPTGSTAYSMAVGASIINPVVPAVLVTPINAHTLSCRPLVLPMSVHIEVSIDESARANAVYLSNDGRLQHQNIIRKKDVVSISSSKFPVPCFISNNPVADWFCDLANCLNWNVRHRQNEFNETRFLSDQFQEFEKNV